MKHLVVFLICAGLFSCADSDDEELRKPGAEGPVLINVWDLETGRTTKIEASAIDVVGNNFSELILYTPKMRMPLAQGHIYMSTDEAFVEQGQIEQFIINKEVHLHGEVDGKPLTGTAQGLEFIDSGKMCKLKSADFIWGKKHVTVGTLQLESGSVLKGDNWNEVPVD